MSVLPPGWAEAPIGSLCTLNNGRAFKPTEWASQGLPIVRIQNLNNPNARFNHFSGTFEDRYHLRGGELLFAWSGTPGTSFGAHVWRGGAAVLNQHIFRVDFGEAYLDKRFFRYAINQKLGELIDIAHGGVGLRHVTKGIFERTLVAVPPRNEQKGIADTLDALLARVDACREGLDRVPALLKRFRQSVLTVATSGGLTTECRVNASPESAVSATPGWPEQPLVSLCDDDRVITYGVIKLGDETPGGVPCLRTSNVRWLRVDPDGIKRISPTLSAEYARTILRGGEVLVNVRGTLGGVAVVSQDMTGWNVSREVAVVPVDTARVHPSYLALWVASERSQRWLSRVEKGATYIGINIEDLRNLPVNVAPMVEQLEIVRRVEALFAYADRLEERYAAARAQTDRLTPALLAKAFRGELVPQDPNDEPASVLLERIHAVRDTLQGADARKRRSRAVGPEAPQKPEVLMLARKDVQPTHLTAILKDRGALTAETLWSASELDIDDFYAQLKDEEARGLLKETRSNSSSAPRLLSATT